MVTPIGRLLISRGLSADERERLGIAEAALDRVPEGTMADYLTHHRKVIFVDRQRPDGQT